MWFEHTKTTVSCTPISRKGLFVRNGPQLWHVHVCNTVRTFTENVARSSEQNGAEELQANCWTRIHQRHFHKVQRPSVYHLPMLWRPTRLYQRIRKQCFLLYYAQSTYKLVAIKEVWHRTAINCLYLGSVLQRTAQFTHDTIRTNRNELCNLFNSIFISTFYYNFFIWIFYYYLYWFSFFFSFIHSFFFSFFCLRLFYLDYLMIKMYSNTYIRNIFSNACWVVLLSHLNNWGNYRQK